MAYKDFTEMSVRQKAFNLLVKIYSVTQSFPKEEKYGITSDIRRAPNSVVHNIAEGFGRFEKRDKTRFYKISREGVHMRLLVKSWQDMPSNSLMVNLKRNPLFKITKLLF